MRCCITAGYREQMQVMVSEYGDSAFPQAFYEPQGIQAIWPAVNKVAGKPQLILCRFEIDSVQ